MNLNYLQNNKQDNQIETNILMGSYVYSNNLNA